MTTARPDPTDAAALLAGPLLRKLTALGWTRDTVDSRADYAHDLAAHVLRRLRDGAYSSERFRSGAEAWIRLQARTLASTSGSSVPVGPAAGAGESVRGD